MKKLGGQIIYSISHYGSLVTEAALGFAYFMF